MKKVISIILFCIALIGSSAQDKPKIVDIDISKSQDKLSEVFENVEFIQLETSKECLLVAPADITISDNKIFVFDGGRKMLVFSIDGKFIREIGRKGRGPGEILQMADVWVDNDNHQVEILDFFSRKINVYDFHGNLIKQVDGFQAATFGKRIDGNYLFYSEFQGLRGQNIDPGAGIEMVMIDSSGQIISTFNDEYIPFGTFIAPSMANCLKSLNSKLIFNPHRSCTIYNVVGENLIPYYQFRFKKANVPDKELKKGQQLTLEEYKKLDQKYVTDVYNFTETPSFIYFWFRFDHKVYYAFYDKLNGKSITICKDQLVNDLAFSRFYAVGSSGNRAIVYIPAIDFKEQVENHIEKLSKLEQEKFKKEHSDLWRIYINVSINDNPIIAIYTFKSFV